MSDKAIESGYSQILAGDLATWRTVRAGNIKVMIICANNCAYGRSAPTDKNVFVRITSRWSGPFLGGRYYRTGERVSVSPLWLSLRKRQAELIGG